MSLNAEEITLIPYLAQCRRAGKLRHTDEIFTTAYPGEALPLCFNVTRAKLAAPRRPLIEIPLKDMQFLAQHYTFDPAKVAQMDPSIPGIAAFIWNTYEQRGAPILIDGTHRCMQSLLRGIPYQAHLLNVVQSYVCLLVAPDEVWAHRNECVAPVLEHRPHGN